MTSTSERRWQGNRSERLAWASFSMGLIGLLLLSLVLLVESLDPSSSGARTESPWFAQESTHAPARAAPLEVAALEDLCRGVRTE